MARYLISFPSAAMLVSDAVSWAARIAQACRCAQELRVFQLDRAS